VPGVELSQVIVRGSPSYSSMADRFSIKGGAGSSRDVVTSSSTLKKVKSY
jgi:hypothetical protein